MIKRLQVIIAGLLLSSSWGGLSALTLDECREKAGKHYPEIAEYDVIRLSEQFTLSNVSKAWLPQGNIYAQATGQNAVMQLPEQFTNIIQSQDIDYPGLKPLQYKVGAEISQQIWDGGHSVAARRRAEADAEVDRRRIDSDLYDVDARVCDIYFGTLLLDERIAGSRLTLALLDSTLCQIQVMITNGIAMESDCYQVEAQRIAVEQQIDRLLSARAAYIRMLAIFIGEEPGDLLRPSMSVAPSEIVEPTERLFEARLRSLEVQKLAVKSSSMPTFGAFASAFYGYPGLNYFKSMESGRMTFNLLAGIKIQWNFGALYTRRNSLKSMELGRRSVETARETFNFNRSISLAQQNADIKALEEVIKKDDLIVDLRNRVLDAATAQLQNGILDTTALLSKITDARLAETEREAHRLELLQAMYRLNHIQNQ